MSDILVNISGTNNITKIIFNSPNASITVTHY